jgi:predicted ATP-dependent serine protease
VLHWAREAFDPLPPISWVVDSLFSRGSVSLVVGAPGTKKTYSLIDCAVNVAIGDEWLGRATSQGTVLIIDEESGNHRLRRRLKEIMRGHKTSIDLPIAYTTLATWNLLSSPTDLQYIDGLLAETQPVMVILDALADVMPGGDENAVKDTHPVFQRLRVLAERYRCAVVVIHHANRMGAYRGSTAIAGAVDLLLMVDSQKGSTSITFKTEKSRDTEPQEFGGQMLFDEEMGTARLIAYAVEPAAEPISRAEQYVVEYLEAHDRKAALTEIVNAADVCSPATARRAVYRLAEAGKVRRADANGSGVKATYELC